MPASFDRFGTFGRFALVSVAAASVAGCGINSVPSAEEAAKAKWADVQAAFQERANLIVYLNSKSDSPLPLPPVTAAKEEAPAEGDAKADAKKEDAAKK